MEHHDDFGHSKSDIGLETDMCFEQDASIVYEAEQIMQ